MNEDSSWFTGFDEKFFFGKGAFCAAMHPRAFLLFSLYYVWRYRRAGNLTNRKKLKWMKHGKKGYCQMLSYDEMKKQFG